jgi:hypothetical protein
MNESLVSEIEEGDRHDDDNRSVAHSILSVPESTATTKLSRIEQWALEDARAAEKTINVKIEKLIVEEKPTSITVRMTSIADLINKATNIVEFN